MIILLILITQSLDNVWKSLGENWSYSVEVTLQIIAGTILTIFRRFRREAVV